MCVSDIRLARLVRHRAQAFNTTGPVNTTFPRNPQRVALLIARDAAVLGATAATVVTFESGAVIQLTSAGSIGLLRVEEYGDLIMMGFVLTATLTAHTGIVTEFYLPESVISANPSEFSRSQ